MQSTKEVMLASQLHWSPRSKVLWHVSDLWLIDAGLVGTGLVGAGLVDASRIGSYAGRMPTVAGNWFRGFGPGTANPCGQDARAPTRAPMALPWSTTPVAGCGQCL